MVPPSQITRAIASEFECSIREWETLDGGRAAQTYRFALDTEPSSVVCKVGGPSVRTGDVIEPLVLELVDQLVDVPAPDVLMTGTLANEDATPWAVYEFREGTPPTPYRSLDPTVQERIVADVGSTLGRVHAARAFERTGGFARTGNALQIRTPDGLDFPRRGRRLLSRVGASAVEAGDPVLSHGDLYPGNLLVDDRGRITGLVDWGNAQVTTPGYALARARMRFIDWFLFPSAHRQRLAVALRDGYRKHRPLPADYPERVRVHQLLWLAQSADRLRRHARTSRGRQRLRAHAETLLSQCRSRLPL